MLVRPAIPPDLGSIVEIYNQFVTSGVATFDLEPVTVAERGPWLAQFGAEHPLLVAERADEVLGFAYYLPFRPKAGYARTKETTVYVREAAHGRGVGSALYAALIERAQRAGVHVLVAVLGGDNPASAALHRKHGFEMVGCLREVGWKHGRWVDTSYWQRTLLSPGAEAARSSG